MNRLFVGTGLVILVVALFFINQGVNKSGRADHEDDAPPPAAAKPVPAANRPAPPPAVTTEDLPAEQALGNPATAKHHITIGWTYSEANQKAPDTLAKPLQAVQDLVKKSGGAVSAEIVNVAVPSADRSPAAQGVAGSGVFVDGTAVSGDISATPPQQTTSAIQAAIR